MTALFQQQPKSTMFAPQGDLSPDTVSGQLAGGILATDGAGNYTNPVVRQAVDRQEQAFNARGLRNTSMAVQGGTEAAISKAIEIAGPDAQSNFDRRTRYLDAVASVGQNYQRMLDTINASQMTPEDKSVAIAQAAAVRDGEMAFQNNLYSKVPGWQQGWLAPAVPSYGGAGVDVSRVTNMDMLANIANDPANPQDQRDAAMERLRALQISGTGMTATGMDAPDQQEAAEYAAYRASGGPLTIEQWLSQRRHPKNGGAAGMMGPLNLSYATA